MHDYSYTTPHGIEVTQTAQPLAANGRHDLGVGRLVERQAGGIVADFQ